MPRALPTLRNTAQQALYPFTKITSCLTNINQFQNAMEQRSVARPPLYGFLMPMSTLTAMDKLKWLNFHVSALGRFNTDIQLTLQSNVYNNLALMSDNLVALQKATVLYDQQVTLRQVAAANFSSYTPPTVGVLYPRLQFGLTVVSSSGTELPFTQASNFLTSVGDTPFGPRYAYSWYNPTSPLTGFPTTYLRSWKLSYPLLDDTDAGTLENYFLGMQGRYSTFYFTDPTSIAVLTAPMNAFDLVVSISDGSTVQNGGYVTIGTETLGVVSGGGVTGPATLTVTRHALGTPISAHALGSNMYVTYPNVRFAADEFSLKYLTLNQNSTELELVQVFA